VTFDNKLLNSELGVQRGREGLEKHASEHRYDPLAAASLGSPALRGGGGVVFHGVAHGGGRWVWPRGPAPVTVKPWEQNCKTRAWTHY